MDFTNSLSKPLKKCIGKIRNLYKYNKKSNWTHEYCDEPTDLANIIKINTTQGHSKQVHVEQLQIFFPVSLAKLFFSEFVEF